MYVYSFVGPHAASDPREYHYDGLATRRTLEIVFPNEVVSGASAWISAAWVSRRGERGMAAAPIQVTIQGGPVCATSLKLAA